MTDKIIEAVLKAVDDSFGVKTQISLVKADPKFGDYATNVAFQVAKDIGKSPPETAEAVIAKLDLGDAGSAEQKGGFINIKLSDSALASELNQATLLPKIGEHKLALVEFGDANPFKDMHIGHLYNTIVGDGISGLFEAYGFSVKRLSYHGDVGLHVAKWIYGVGSEIDFDPTKFTEALSSGGDDPLGYFYARGEKAYTESDEAASKIKEINKHIYAQDDPKINEIYRLGKETSFEQFDKIFALLGVHYNKRYLESETASIGKKLVEENIGKVFEKSQGAVIYEGEAEGLHTRVFITSNDLPTYETKDLGFAVAKDKDYPNAQKSIIITANEQSDYFAVMLAALSKIKPNLAKVTVHLGHGFLSLKAGKMSSREGNVYTAQTLIDEVKKAVETLYPDSPAKHDIYISALRYELMKHKLGSDIVFDINESISLEGNSGPYILYAHARARSILKKSDKQPSPQNKFEPAERRLAIAICGFRQAADEAFEGLKPHTICNYLFGLAGEFNSFYETNRVIGDDREEIRLKLISAYAEILKTGLGALNIPAPEKM
ncbi:MAG TPA: arginine--tRNA ligase [Candidatus Saccharimonadales bacterium]|nr:arginine--tRNA ligase [Candidatus Saccharimonadales bacterium]